jgi:ribose transport system ATP-binding protein
MAKAETTDIPVVSIKNLSKVFPGIRALNDVSLDVYRGEVLVLLGENGAGKSTLMKILAGAYQKSGGTIFIKGKKVEITGPRHAKELGISIVYQEQALVPDLDAVSNIFLGKERRKFLKKSALGLLDAKGMAAKVRSLLDDFAVHIDIGVDVRELPLGQKQIIEICRCLADEAAVLILDEPTAALAEKERQYLFKFIRALTASGVAIVYCSHILEECLEIGDRVVVLRDGEKVLDTRMSEVTLDGLIEKMVGKALKEQYPKEKLEISPKVRLNVVGLAHKNGFDGISFKLREREIIGLAGLEGCGKYEVVRALFGLDRAAQGYFEIDGARHAARGDVNRSMEDGLAFLPADRKAEGLFLDQPISFNFSIANLKRITRMCLSSRRESRCFDEYARTLSIKATSAEQLALNLSGGNQQKLMIARWLFRDPKILVIEEPTRGIDVRAKTEVYRLIGKFAAGGGSVIIVSSDLPELAEICDRVLVMFDGKITKELSGDDLTQERILECSVSGRSN